MIFERNIFWLFKTSILCSLIPIISAILWVCLILIIFSGFEHFILNYNFHHHYYHIIHSFIISFSSFFNFSFDFHLFHHFNHILKIFNLNILNTHTFKYTYTLISNFSNFDFLLIFLFLIKISGLESSLNFNN